MLARILTRCCVRHSAHTHQTAAQRKRRESASSVALNRCALSLCVRQLLVCALHLVCGTAFPTPRGDPSARPPLGVKKHALVELMEQSAPLARPARDWRAPELKSWLDKGDLSAGLGLPLLRKLQVPVYLNVFTIGLEGAGNLGLTMSPEQLAQWMQHLEHVVPQRIIKTGAESARENTQETEHASSTRRRSRSRLDNDEDDPAASSSGDDSAALSFRYHIRLVSVSPKVVQVLERYLGVHYRVENAAHTVFQVDAEVVSGMLEGLAKHLKLNDAYNLFVLNPSSDWLVVPASVPLDHPVSYGYRSGFSNDELDQLLDPNTADASLKKTLGEWALNPLASYEQTVAKGRQAPPQEGPQFVHKQGEQMPDGSTRVPQLQVVEHMAASDAWATAVLAAPHFTGPQPLLSYLKQQAQHHPEVLRAAVGNPFAHEDCLVDSWVGRGRSLFLDLSAGPFGWGPIVGGEGVKTPETYPSMRHFAAARAAELAAAAAEEGSEDGYVDASYDADAVAAERIVLLDLLDSQCGGSDSDATGGRESSAECLEINEKLRDLSEFESAHAERIRGASDATPKPGVKAPPLDSPEGMSFFHDETAEEGGVNSGHDASIEADHFLAHLSATLSASLHHVVTPSVSDMSHRDTGYAEQIVFHLYVLVNHQYYDPLGDSFVDRFKYSVDQLRLFSQSFRYVVHKLTMDDDPVLAMSYSSALRSATIPSIGFDGKFQAIKRMYLDSATLERNLQMAEAKKGAKLFDGPSAASDKSSTRNKVRDISLFLFSLDFPLPVLVDKFFQSVALPSSDLVVAVQSSIRLWEAPLTCNGQPLFWNLRDPLRAMLSSVAQVLGGTMPAHVKYSAAHGRVAQDWSWSVGASPLALTSAMGLEFSQMQRDALHRNYVLSSIRSATARVNAALKRLAREKTTVANRMLAGLDDRAPLSSEEQQRFVSMALAAGSSTSSATAGRFSLRTLECQLAYGAVLDTVQNQLRAMEVLDFDDAATMIRTLEDKTSDFVGLVDGVIAWNSRDKCTSSAAAIEANANRAAAGSSAGWLQLSSVWYLATACVCSAVVLYRIMVPRNDKPKLN